MSITSSTRLDGETVRFTFWFNEPVDGWFGLDTPWGVVSSCSVLELITESITIPKEAVAVSAEVKWSPNPSPTRSRGLTPTYFIDGMLHTFTTNLGLRGAVLRDRHGGERHYHRGFHEIISSRDLKRRN